MIAAIRFKTFSVGVEQADNPALLGRPFAVTAPSRHGLTTLFSCSAEAVQQGLAPGQLLTEAQARCSNLAHGHLRWSRYAEVSQQLMEVLRGISPQLEVVTLDEAWLDLTSCQSYYRNRPEDIATLIRRELGKVLPLSCGIGIGGDKATAAYAARCALDMEPGYWVVAPEQAASVLADVPVARFCDVGAELQEFLQTHGIHHCGEVAKLPVGALQQRFGALGTQFWLMTQGRDPRPVVVEAASTEGLQAGKLLPAETRDGMTVLFQLHQLCEKLALQMARRREPGTDFTFSLRCDQGWRQARFVVPQATHDAQVMFLLGKRFLRQNWLGEAVLQLRVQAHPLITQPGQRDIFPVSALHARASTVAVQEPVQPLRKRQAG